MADQFVVTLTVQLPDGSLYGTNRLLNPETVRQNPWIVHDTFAELARDLDKLCDWTQQ